MSTYRICLGKLGSCYKPSTTVVTLKLIISLRTGGPGQLSERLRLKPAYIELFLLKLSKFLIYIELQDYPR